MISEPSAVKNTLYCCICTQPIPDKRATRQTSTCSEKCKNKLDAVRADQRRDRKCPFCLHPSTPEERLLFRAFMVSLGKRRSEVVTTRERTPNETPRHLLRKALREAMSLLEANLDHFPALDSGNAVETIPEAKGAGLKERVSREMLVEKIKQFKMLIDTKGGKQSMLGASGTAAQENDNGIL